MNKSLLKFKIKHTDQNGHITEYVDEFKCSTDALEDCVKTLGGSGCRIKVEAA